MIATEAGLSRRTPLVLILVAAVVQGWALYGLHIALVNDWWPANQQSTLLALYTLAVFIPTTVQLLAEHHRQRQFWPLIAALTLAFGYFGWHHGSISAAEFVARESLGGTAVAVTLIVLWLMALPFVANRLREKRWIADYASFFSTAWHNKLLLAEAAVFTIVFWLLLGLWATLFRLLGIDFFLELFREPVFIYPVTAIVFGFALYLIGSAERFVSVVLEQILGLFKWLAVVAGLIVVLFSIALLFKLPGLLESGTRAIGAAWLLWLLAVMILLLNAAYRDGSNPHPYPGLLATALRYVVPAMVLVAIVAFYALGVRIAGYGLTTERFWALIVVLAGLVYAGGYAVAAFRSGPWMAGVGKVNVGVALGLIASLALTLTPLLSPYRLAANSQYERILEEGGEASTTTPYQSDSYRTLRFGLGKYGRTRLEELAKLEDHPDATQIRERATAVLAANDQWAIPVESVDLERLQVYPAGRSLDPALLAALTSGANPQSLPPRETLPSCGVPESQCAGLYVDLDADSKEEFVLFSPYIAWVYVQDGNTWRRENASFNIGGETKVLLDALAAGDFGTEPGRYRDLRIGNRMFEIIGATPFVRGPALAPAPATSAAGETSAP